jgi:hypothetical protein
MLGLLAYAGTAVAEPTAATGKDAAEPEKARPGFAARAGAEWGILSAPIDTYGRYLRPDGSANVSFYETGTDRDLIAGRLEVGAAIPIVDGGGLFPRGGLVLGSSPSQARSVVVAGVPLAYVSQPMFFALAAGLEIQFARRVLGVGVDLGWASSWDGGGPVTPAELQLTRHGRSGPYFRFAATARLPWSRPYGLGLYAAAEVYLISDAPWSPKAHSRTAVGAFFEWDTSR